MHEEETKLVAVVVEEIAAKLAKICVTPLKSPIFTLPA